MVSSTDSVSLTEKKTLRKYLEIFWWLQVGDLITTLYSLKEGGLESNRIFGSISNNWAFLVIAKISVTIFLIWLIFSRFQEFTREKIWMMIALNGYFLYVVGSNAWILYNLMNR